MFLEGTCIESPRAAAPFWSEVLRRVLLASSSWERGGAGRDKERPGSQPAGRSEERLGFQRAARGGARQGYQWAGRCVRLGDALSTWQPQGRALRWPSWRRGRAALSFYRRLRGLLRALLLAHRAPRPALFSCHADALWDPQVSVSMAVTRVLAGGGMGCGRQRAQSLPGGRADRRPGMVRVASDPCCRRVRAWAERASFARRAVAAALSLGGAGCASGSGPLLWSADSDWRPGPFGSAFQNAGCRSRTGGRRRLTLARPSPAQPGDVAEPAGGRCLQEPDFGRSGLLPAPGCKHRVPPWEVACFP